MMHIHVPGIGVPRLLLSLTTCGHRLCAFSTSVLAAIRALPCAPQG